MFDRNFLLLQLPATLGAGLIAGTFFCFSSFVMPALTRLETQYGVTAMQKINITVINPLFMAVLFGTAILYAVKATMVLRSGFGNVSLCWLAAALLYIAGTIGVTIIFNVPLNDRLDSLTLNSGDVTDVWTAYVRDWTFWNSLRALAATAACVASICAISLSP
jgi:uncharacterized membrane protein